MHTLSGNSEHSDISFYINETIKNPIISDVIDEGAQNITNLYGDENLEIRGFLKKYVTSVCMLCSKNGAKVSNPDIKKQLWKNKFQSECGDLFSVEAEKELLRHIENVYDTFPTKIKASKDTTKRCLGKLFNTATQIFFSYYYNFDYRKLILSEEEFLAIHEHKTQATGEFGNTIIMQEGVTADDIVNILQKRKTLRKLREN